MITQFQSASCAVAFAVSLLAGCSSPGEGHTVGGTVKGLTGSGLVLQVNGGHDLGVVANAASFRFTCSFARGAAYVVSVLAQPNDPAEVCSVAHGTGTIGSSDASGVVVSCRLASCGNGLVDTGEGCDDGNNASGDGCSADCKRLEGCGNDHVDPGEEVG